MLSPYHPRKHELDESSVQTCTNTPIPKSMQQEADTERRGEERRGEEEVNFFCVCVWKGSVVANGNVNAL